MVLAFDIERQRLVTYVKRAYSWSTGQQETQAQEWP